MRTRFYGRAKNGAQVRGNSTAAYIFLITLSIDGDALARLAQRGFGFLGDVGAVVEVNGGKVAAVYGGV